MAQLLYNSSFDTVNHPININSFFDYFIKLEKPENAVLVLPTNKYVNWAKEQFIRKYFEIKKKPTPELRFYRLQDFAQMCLEKVTPNECKYKLLSDAAMLTMMEEAIKDLDLQYFNKNTKKISLNILQKIMQIIIGLKEDGITPDNMNTELKDMPQKINSANLRFIDLTKIYQRYEKLINEKFIDNPGVFYKIITHLEKCDKENLPFDTLFDSNTIIMFNGFTEFKLPEAEFVAKFANSKIPTIVNIDYSQITGPNIESLPKNVRRLVIANDSNLNQQSEGLINNENDDNSEVLPSEHIKKWLYNENVNLLHQNLLKQVKILEAVDRIDEVKNLAKLVRYLNEEKKIDFSDICICSRTPELYSDLFREFFSENGLVINISDRFSLENATPIVLTLGLLEIVANDWKRYDIERVMFSKELKEIVPNISTLVTIAKKYRILNLNKINNLERWKDDLQNIQQSKYDKFIGKNIEQIDIAIETLKQLKKILNFNNQKYTFTEFANIVQSVLAKFKITENIFYKYKELIDIKNEYNLNCFQLREELEKNGKAIANFIKLIKELEQIEIERDRGETQYQLTELIEKLKIATSGTRYQINEKKSLGVNITSIEQTRGIPYKAIILCGAVDTEFPLAFKIDTFLGKELPASKELHYNNEKILFYQFLTNNVELLDKYNEYEEQKNEPMRIYITYPIQESTRKLVRSPFIDDLCGITNTNETNENIIKLKDLKENKNGNLDELMKNELEWINYITQTSDIINHIIHSQQGVLLNDDKYLEIKNIFTTTQDEIKNKNGVLTLFAENFQKELNKYKKYSISQLETYAQCPFKYFANNILKIYSQEYSDDELSPIDYGSYLHSILEVFYKDRINNSKKEIGNFKCVDLKENNSSNELYFNKLRDIAGKLLPEFEFPLFKYEKAKLIGDNGILKSWINNEMDKINNENWKFYPTLFEYNFEFEYTFDETIQSDNETNEKTANGIKIDGKIDRIEISEDGTYFVVADYKLKPTGINTINDMKNGKSLQIPIYLLALKQQEKFNSISPYGGIYYILVDDKTKPTYCYWSVVTDVGKDNTKNIKNTINIDELLNESLNFAIEYKNRICSFSFNSSKNKYCNSCNYKNICRNKQK